MNAVDVLRDVLPNGRENAVPGPVLASELGVPVRTLQQWVGEAIEQGLLIGSSCGERPGFFLIRDLEDLEAGTAHIRARALGSLHRWSTVRKAALARFSEPDVLRLFDLDEERGRALNGHALTTGPTGSVYLVDHPSTGIPA